MSTFYDSPNDYRNYLCHYGVKGMKRPHGLKYKKRGISLREHRLDQVLRIRKTGALQDMNEDRDRRIRESRAESHSRASEDHRTEEISRARAHDDEKRRQQEILEEHMRQEAERRASTKGDNQSLSGDKKRLQNLVNQTGVITPGRHQAMYYQQQIRNRRRRRH